MRRSVEKVDSFSDKVQLGVSGEIVRVEKKEQAKRLGNDDCNVDYVVGHMDTDNCSNVHHSHITTSSMCEEAARKMKVPMYGITESPSFYTPTADYEKYPKGCYKSNCTKDGVATECVFFNRVFTWPTSVEAGAPVCSRPLIVSGGVDKNGVENGTCPDGYMVITNETYCSEAAGCVADCDGSPDEVIGVHNRTLHDLYPQGCFKHPVDNCGYFNPKYPNRDMTDWVPGNAKGTPICTASESWYYTDGIVTR